MQLLGSPRLQAPPSWGSMNNMHYQLCEFLVLYLKVLVICPWIEPWFLFILPSHSLLLNLVLAGQGMYTRHGKLLRSRVALTLIHSLDVQANMVTICTVLPSPYIARRAALLRRLVRDALFHCQRLRVFSALACGVSHRIIESSA